MGFYNLDEKNDYSMHVGIRPALDVINSDENHNVIKNELLKNIYDYEAEDLYNVLTCYYNYKLDNKTLRSIEVRFILTASDSLLKKSFNGIKTATLKKYLEFTLSSFPSFAMKLLSNKKMHKESFLSELYSVEELIDFIFNTRSLSDDKKLNNICILYDRGYYADYKRGENIILNARNPKYILKFAGICKNHIDLLMVAKVLEDIKDLDALYNFAISYENIDTQNIAKILFDSKNPLYILLSSIYLDNTLLNKFNSYEDVFVLLEKSLEDDSCKTKLIRALSGIIGQNKKKAIDGIVESLFEESNSKNLHKN